MDTQAELTHYYNRIKRALHCPSQAKDSILNSIQADIEEFIETHPSATIADIQVKFGKPEAYAQEYIASMNKQDIYHTVSTKKFRNKLYLFTGLAIIFIVSLLFIYIVAYYNNNGGPYYYSESISNIIVETASN